MRVPALPLRNVTIFCLSVCASLYEAESNTNNTAGTITCNRRKAQHLKRISHSSQTRTGLAFSPLDSGNVEQD